MTTRLPKTLTLTAPETLEDENVKKLLGQWNDEFQRIHMIIRDALNNPRLLAADPTVTAAYGKLGEVAYFNDQWYGKTVATGKDTDWVQIS